MLADELNLSQKLKSMSLMYKELFAIFLRVSLLPFFFFFFFLNWFAWLISQSECCLSLPAFTTHFTHSIRPLHAGRGLAADNWLGFRVLTNKTILKWRRKEMKYKRPFTIKRLKRKDLNYVLGGWQKTRNSTFSVRQQNALVLSVLYLSTIPTKPSGSIFQPPTCCRWEKTHETLWKLHACANWC